MYGHFIQFTIPKIGQALVAVVLYLNFLKLPFVACFAGAHPAVYLLLPLLLLAVMSSSAQSSREMPMVMVRMSRCCLSTMSMVSKIFCRLSRGSIYVGDEHIALAYALEVVAPRIAVPVMVCEIAGGDVRILY